jgi:hypothetical protein
MKMFVTEPDKGDKVSPHKVVGTLNKMALGITLVNSPEKAEYVLDHTRWNNDECQGVLAEILQIKQKLGEKIVPKSKEQQENYMSIFKPIKVVRND